MLVTYVFYFPYYFVEDQNIQNYEHFTNFKISEDL